ncbi:MAG: DNA methyltransferase, partial [Candidatus Contendobacter sp.]|nr:DNA methyltransferase [Candidatus Contendobacter sp.]
QSSETVFAIQGGSAGIKVGVAITLMARRLDKSAAEATKIFYRDFDHARASERRAALLESLNQEPVYHSLDPLPELGFPFKPRTMGRDYLSWPILPDLFPTYFPGVKTSRDDFLVDIDRDRLLHRMMTYFDPTVSHDAMRRQYPGIMTDSARFRTEAARDMLRQRGFLPNHIVRYAYRPFDVRWLYWEPETKLLDEKRTDYFVQIVDGNYCLVTQQKPRRGWSVAQITRSIGCLDLMDRGASFFPLFLRNPLGEEPHPNLSQQADAYLNEWGEAAESLIFHALAILHSPAYQQENADALRQDWPRLPLPASHERLKTSAALGRQLAALLDSETPAPGITAGKIRPELRVIAVLSHLEVGKSLDPATGDLDLTTGWGHAGKGGVTMPGRGKIIERDYTPVELAALGEAVTLLGERTCDVYLNDRACWRNIPDRIWNYSLGGYPVIKKWLSYREKALLGRSLKPEEAREVSQMIRRITAIVLMEAELDGNYQAVTAAESRLKSRSSPRLAG